MWKLLQCQFTRLGTSVSVFHFSPDRRHCASASLCRLRTRLITRSFPRHGQCLPVYTFLTPRCLLSHIFSQMTTVHDACAVAGAGPEAYMFSRRLSVHLRNKASTISVPRKKWEKLSNRTKNRARVIYRGSKTRKTEKRRDGHSGYVSTKVSFATKRAGISKMSIDAFQKNRDVVAGIAPVVQL